MFSDPRVLCTSSQENLEDCTVTAKIKTRGRERCLRKRIFQFICFHQLPWPPCHLFTNELRGGLERSVFIDYFGPRLVESLLFRVVLSASPKDMDSYLHCADEKDEAHKGPATPGPTHSSWQSQDSAPCVLNSPALCSSAYLPVLI